MKIPHNTDSFFTRMSKRKLLNLEERVSVIKRHDKGETAIKIATDLGVGKTQIQTIIKEKEKILKKWETGENPEKKQNKRRCLYDELDEKVWQWFVNTRSRNLPITGKLIQEKALILASQLGNEGFSASNGWLDRFVKRHNIKAAIHCGESAEVSQEAVEDWTNRLPSICEGYSPNDIFNADETGIQYRSLPTKSMVKKGETTSGVKVSKERVTVMLCCSMSGEKVRPLVIGHSAKPRCFRNSDMNSLGVDYYHNRKAWMTIPIFTEWAKKFNNKMKLQKRNVLLFIDNCTAHVAIPLSNVKIVLLPPNATSKLQPCDAGVIQTVKLLYRKTFLRQLLFHMDNDQTATGPELCKKITLLNAIVWLRVAWLRVKTSTIQKCFLKCGFNFCLGEVSNESEDNVSENQSDPDFRPVLNGVTLGEYVNFDNETPVCDDSVSDNIIACPEEIESDDGEECDDTTVESFEPIDCATAMSYAEKRLQFGLKHGKMDIVDCMVAVSKDIETVQFSKKKQTKISDFFKKM